MGEDGAEGETEGEEGEKKGRKRRLFMVKATPDVLKLAMRQLVIFDVCRTEEGTHQTRTSGERCGPKSGKGDERLR
jgi:hypothetical protein